MPLRVNRRNAVERVIMMFKNHCMSCLATCDPDFPIEELDRLIPQAVITLNLRLTLRINTKLSSYAYLKGIYDFNSYLLASVWTKISIHKMSVKRRVWGYHATKWWSIGPLLDHYRCKECCIPKTKAEVDTDTIKLIQNKIPIFLAKTEDYLKKRQLMTSSQF